MCTLTENLLFGFYMCTDISSKKSFHPFICMFLKIFFFYMCTLSETFTYLYLHFSLVNEVTFFMPLHGHLDFSGYILSFLCISSVTLGADARY